MVLGILLLSVQSIGRYVRGNMNPAQSPYTNLPAAACTYAIGGMATHWTAHCPRPHSTVGFGVPRPHEACLIDCSPNSLFVHHYLTCSDVQAYCLAAAA